jgi:hypothetical protein
VRTVEAMWAANIDDWGWVAHSIREAGDQVLALVEMTGRVRDSGVPVSRRLGIVASDIHGGVVGAIHADSTWDQALRAVGLE